MAPERCSSMPGKTARSSRTADSRLVPRACLQSSSVRASTPPGSAEILRFGLGGTSFTADRRCTHGVAPYLLWLSQNRAGPGRRVKYPIRD